MKTAYNFFRFLENKKGKKIPFLAKLIHAPETIAKEDLYVKSDLDLSDTSIRSLPKGLKVGGSLYLSNTSIQSLPEGLTVRESLSLSDTSIQTLPKGLKVEKSLYIYNTPLSKKYTEEEIRKMIEETVGYVKGKIIL